MRDSEFISPQQVRHLLSGSLGVKCAYITGAGLVHPLNPVGKGLARRRLEFALRNFGDIIPSGSQSVSAARRLYIPEGLAWSGWVRGVDRQRSLEMMRVEEHEILRITPPFASPPALSVFDYFPWRVHILTYNTDGLIDFVNPRHVVGELHGRFRAGFPFGWDVKAVYRFARSKNGIAPTTFYPFEREYPDIYGPTETALLVDALGDCTDVVFVGYSFARHRRGINDTEALSAVRALLHGRSVRIVVIEPNPGELIDTLRWEIPSAAVIGVPARWNLLAQAIISVSRQTVEGDIRGALRFPDRVVREYLTYLDAGDREIDKAIERAAELGFSREVFSSVRNYFLACKTDISAKEDPWGPDDWVANLVRQFF